MAQLRMDPNEIIKAAPELLKHGAELVSALKLSEITKTILGPATGEFAERVKDEIRLYRFGRQLELLKKAEKMVQDAGFTPKAVPIKLLFPLLEGASLEENEDLHTMWAALLANAAQPDGHSKVSPGFIPVLRQLSAADAFVLDWINKFPNGEKGEGSASRDRIHDAHKRYFGATELSEDIPLSHLTSISLIEDHDSFFALTNWGRFFIEACTMPKPKS